MTIGYARKDRRDRTTGKTIFGRVHRIESDPLDMLTLCGLRLKGLNVRISDLNLHGDACDRCKANARTGRRDPWRRR